MLHYTGQRENWFAYKDERMKEVVEEWMKENKVVYENDRASCNSWMVTGYFCSFVARQMIYYQLTHVPYIKYYFQRPPDVFPAKAGNTSDARWRTVQRSLDGPRI